MIALRQRCLEPAELQLMVHGRMATEEFDSVISHLDDCESCRQAVEALEPEEEWQQESLIESQSDPLQGETACQVALGRMLQSPKDDGAPEHVEGSDGEVSSSVPKVTLGPYQLVRPLAAGGMGTVYLAQHQRLRRRCAIKLLPRERVDQPGWLERFDREMTTVAALEHPHVVRATDAGHQDGWHYLVMEYLDGLDVGRIAGRMQQLACADACEIVRQAALGLAHVHSFGLVHRDVKPSNLVLTREGSVKILDLGLVLSGDDPLAMDERLTTVGHLMGTMPYIAPEQLIDSRDVDPRADIYALGATLFRLIAGKPPHPRNGGLAQHVMAITQQDAPRLDTVRGDVPRELIELVSQMLSRDPSARPTSAATVAERLTPMCQGQRLKRLLRQAIQKTSQAEAPVSLLRTATVSVDPPERHVGNRFWLLGSLGAFLLLAGFVFKIATDRGDLVVKSDSEDVVLSLKQGDNVVKRLKVTVGEDNRFTIYKGTYIVEIENAEGSLTLDKNVVWIGRGTTSPIHVQQQTPAETTHRAVDPGSLSVQIDRTKSPSLEDQPGQRMFPVEHIARGAPQQAATVYQPQASLVDRLYQGRDLRSWVNSLKREQDAASLGQSLRAVEVLTRGTDQRESAARESLKPARQLGGFVSTGPGGSQFGDDDPAHVYMGYLLDVFAHYRPHIALRVIDEEFEHGNDRSRLACIWLLQVALQRTPTLQTWIESDETDSLIPLMDREDSERLLASLYQHLHSSVQALKEDTQQRRPLEVAYSLGLRLQTLLDLPFVEQGWLKEYVQQQLQSNEARWRKDGTSPQFGTTASGTFQTWVISEPVLLAAIELDRAGQLDLNWQYIASVLTDKFYGRQSERTDLAIDATIKNAPRDLQRKVDERLRELSGQPGSAFQGFGFGTMVDEIVQWGGKSSLPAYAILREYTVWPKLLPFYAEHGEDVDSSIALLNKLRSMMTEDGIDPNHKDEPLKRIDAAIETLQRRTGDKPPARR